MQGKDGLTYTTERYEAVVSVEHYLEEYVDVETFLEACKQCPNYEAKWSCPSYDFDVIEYWKKYSVLELVAVKIMPDESLVGKKMTPQQQKEIYENIIGEVKAQLTEDLYKREEDVPGSISLSAGSCALCKDGFGNQEGDCARIIGEPCRYPEKMRYSIESLGGNVGTTCSRLMEIELEWIKEGRMPSYFVLVCGLLRP